MYPFPFSQSLLLSNDSTQYDELKKILILSGIFFMGTIILIMSKMQVGHFHLFYLTNDLSSYFITEYSE